jgi:phospholipase/carboxylesterase
MPNAAAGLNLVHRVSLPATAGAAGARFPAVVMVHGWLGNETVMGIFERTIPLGVVVVSPRAPVDANADAKSFGWFPLVEDEAGFQSGLVALREFVRSLPQAYPVDVARVMLMGFSQGAAMCYALMASDPVLSAGVAGLAGFLPEPARAWLTPGRLEGKSIFISHGTQDATVPVEQARLACAAFEQAGADVECHEYVVGHKLNAQGMSDLKHWLASHLGSDALGPGSPS